MPVPGRQEQTLVYRVELDESSVAQIIRTARESVGVGLQQATQVGGDLVTQGQLTAATAVAQVGSHLEFLQRTRSALETPTGMRTSAAGMSVAQALGVRAGLVKPRFSEMRSSLEHRAASVLGDAYSTGGINAMGTVAQGGLLAAGIGAMFLGPPGWVAGTAMLAGEIGLDMGVTSLFERAAGRRGLGAHMRRFGYRRSMEIARQFETDVADMQGSYGELSQVAQAALTNVRFQPGDDVNGALVQAIGDWRVAGKTLGLEKEDALATVGELYRAGIAPGAALGYLGRVGAVSQIGGFSPSAVNANALQFMRGAAAEGYDSLAAGNQFMLQAGMVNRMVREGVLSRNDLTAAAGFAGPEGEQMMGAARNILGQTMALMNTGFGRAISAGAMSGGRGGPDAMLNAAMGMSTQQILGFEANRVAMDNVGATQAAAAGMARQVIQGLGGTVDQSTMTSQLMRMGYGYGVAQVIARQGLNPGFQGVANMTAQRMEMAAAIETSGRPSIISEMGSDVAKHGGDVVDSLWSGASSRRMMGGPLAWAFGPEYTLNPTAWAMGGMEAQRGRAYRGLRGMGRFAADAIDSSFGELFRDVGEGFSSFGRWVGGLFGYERESSGRGEALGTFLTRREVEGMSVTESRRASRSLGDLREEYAQGVGKDDPKGMRGARFAQFLRGRQQQALKDILDAGPTRRLQLRGDRDLLEDELGVDISEEQAGGLLMQTERFRRQLEGAGNLEQREQVMASFRGTLRTFDFMRGANIDQAADLLLDRTQTRFSRAESDRLMKNMDAEGRHLALQKAFGSESSRGRIARQYLKEGSEFIAELEGADNLTEAQFRKIMGKAVAAGDVKRGVASSVRDLTAGGRSIAEGIQQRVLEDAAENVAMARGVEDEAEPDDGPSPEAASEDIGALVSTLNQTNRLLNDLVNKMGG